MKLHIIVFLAALCVASPLTAQTTRQAFLPVGPVEGPAGTISVSVSVDNEWLEVASGEYGKFFEEKEFALHQDVLTRDNILMKVEKFGGGASHADFIGLTGYSLSEESVPFAKLSHPDFDVVEIDEGGLIVELQRIIGAEIFDDAKLALRARIEQEVISTIPFLFPKTNMRSGAGRIRSFYRYHLGTNPGSLLADGEINGEDLGSPLFAEYASVDSGHPQGTTYGWIRDDGTNLYIAIDFTADNTIDGAKDYAAVHIRSGNGTQKYVVSVEKTEWGAAGFSYTEQAGYQHKVYEFVLPLDKMPIADESGDVLVAVETYGTAATTGGMFPDLVLNTLT
ncbi:MAG: hypothetical protein HN368_07810, partial [Spirochaetales bacterium]|nr:hypothetical protein [Spirochaetales bacterium]